MFFFCLDFCKGVFLFMEMKCLMNYFIYHLKNIKVKMTFRRVREGHSKSLHTSLPLRRNVQNRLFPIKKCDLRLI